MSAASVDPQATAHTSGGRSFGHDGATRATKVYDSPAGNFHLSFTDRLRIENPLTDEVQEGDTASAGSQAKQGLVHFLQPAQRPDGTCAMIDADGADDGLDNTGWEYATSSVERTVDTSFCSRNGYTYCHQLQPSIWADNLNDITTTGEENDPYVRTKHLSYVGGGPVHPKCKRSDDCQCPFCAAEKSNLSALMDPSVANPFLPLPECFRSTQFCPSGKEPVSDVPSGVFTIVMRPKEQS